MKKIIDFPNKSVTQEAAAMWLVLLDDGPLDAQQKRDFEQWLEESPLHVEMFLDTLATWDGMSSLSNLSEVFPLERLEVKKESEDVWANWLGWRWIGSSAAILGLLVLVLGYFVVMAGYYETDIGQVKTIQLADGSEISLNTDTKVKVSFSKNVRRVDLLQGEAFFKVARDVQRPFLVIANEKVVTAVGTAFSVYKRNGVVKVAVSEGVVQLQSSEISPSPEEDKAQRKAIATKPAPPVYLESGHLALLNYTEITIEPVDIEVIEKDQAWRRHMLIFEGERLSEVIAEVQRYTSLHLIVDDNIRDISVGGYFRSDDIEGILKALAYNFDLEVAKTQNEVKLKASEVK